LNDIQIAADSILEVQGKFQIFYNLQRLKKLVDFPDHKTRLAATTFNRAYGEGLRVQRQVTAVAAFHSVDETIARTRSSPDSLAPSRTFNVENGRSALGEA
jgi:hypothetical protein